MDIYSAQKQIDKILIYLKSLQAEKQTSTMYSSTRNRLNRISNSCIEASSIVADILADACSRQSNSNAHGNSEPIRLDSDVEPLRLKRKDRSYILHKYDKVIQGLSYESSSVVSNCINILKKWFNLRFIKCTKNFYYNISKLPMWIRNIVISYGQSIYEGSDEKLIADFDNWFVDVSNGANQYAVPYCVYRLEDGLSESDVSLTTAVLWDILYDCGLNQLSTNDINVPRLRLDSSTVYNVCDKVNPAVLDEYRHYSCDSSILSYCKLN